MHGEDGELRLGGLLLLFLLLVRLLLLGRLLFGRAVLLGFVDLDAQRARCGALNLAGEVQRAASRALGIEVDEPEEDGAAEEEAPKKKEADKKKKKKKKPAEPQLPILAVHFANFIVQ